MFNQKALTYKMNPLDSYSYEMGSFRPPSEGQSRSLLIRASRGCSWNRCKFCISRTRERPKFQLRGVEDLKKDIDTIKGLYDELASASLELGHGGEVNRE